MAETIESVEGAGPIRGFKVGEQTALYDYEALANKPDSIKNPKPLKVSVNGAEYSYDGSAEIQIAISTNSNGGADDSGSSGENSGGYYVPVVSQTENTMTITYTPTNSSMGSALDFVIGLPQGEKGEPGENGYTPEKGTDYWTEDDKIEIINAVLKELPSAEGVAF